jgi:ABC-type antimicrobial peptide transport system permease subunit
MAPVMFGLGYRQLRFDLGRSALVCVGIAAVFAVMLLLQGFQQGLNTQLRNVALERDAHLIATQAGVRNMIGVRSVIPQMARAQVESVQGVTVANPMTALPLIYEKDSRKSAIFLFVVDSAGGPREAQEGRLLGGDGEILVDRSLAQLYGLAPGDDFVVAGYPFEIVGIIEPTSALWTPFAFTNYDSLIEFYFEADLADDISAFPLLSYLLVELEPGADPVEVAGRIERAVPDVDVFSPDVLSRGDEALGKTMLGAVLTILVGAAYVAGVLVVGLFMFTAAEARRRDLGILKALGFANRAILMSIVAEVAIVMVIAIPLGIAIAQLATMAARAAMPIYLILPTVRGPLLWAIAACGLFALLGAAGPLRLIRRLEPSEVFRS